MSMISKYSWPVLILALAAAAPAVSAQNLLEGSFADWQLRDGKGQQTTEPQGSAPCLIVTGDDKTTSAWFSRPIPMKPGGWYRLAFQGRAASGNSGGCAVAGPDRINRDFQFGQDWQACSFVFAEPTDVQQNTLRLGQWQVSGENRFKDISLVPVHPLHRRQGALELGAGEKVEAGRYTCLVELSGDQANAHRALYANQASFNSDRWVFSAKSSVTYRHQVGNATQASARVQAVINHVDGGELKIEASTNGTSWAALCQMPAVLTNVDLALPASLFPAREVFVRLSHSGSSGAFQINRYEYQAPLQNPPQDLEGETACIDLLANDSSVTLVDAGLSETWQGGAGQLELSLSNPTAKTRALEVSTSLVPNAKPATVQRVSVRPLSTNIVKVALESGKVGWNEHRVTVQSSSGATLFSAGVRLKLSCLDDPEYGRALPSVRLPGVETWWCESGWKVGLRRAAPQGRSAASKAVTLSLARNEYEAAQVILRPSAEGKTGEKLSLQDAFVDTFKDRHGLPVGIDARIHEVAYVKVTQPTDGEGTRDLYPDPLPPLRTPLALMPGCNRPLWVTVHVSSNTPAGDYRTSIRLKTSRGVASVPLQVHVYNFTLPVQSHLRSALGLGAHFINKYHHLNDRAQQELMYDKYLRNFADHRISPYFFFAYNTIDIRFEGNPKKAVVNFDRFDKAAHQWLDTGRFNNFQLPLHGMGGGTFHSRSLGELEGFQEGTPEHARLFRDYLSQVEEHLRSHGWNQYAFTYWFDEPDPKDYEFVNDGMRRIKAAAPGIKRMLTEQPEPQLIGNVDIWCGLTPEWTREKVAARQAAGEEVWWYICCGPKAPYVTEFIDHPAVCLRLWPWQSWQYGVSGILVWESVYWSSDAAFPAPKLQDPWEDPMSYVSGYDNPPGFIGYWGNGDGRFLYPPRGSTTNAEPCLDEPINSLRWENLRDGMEDYEYFWLLKDILAKAAARGVPEAQLAPARALLEVPAEVSKDLTHFSKAPLPLLQHRDRIARMIETLSKTPTAR